MNRLIISDNPSNFTLIEHNYNEFKRNYEFLLIQNLNYGDKNKYGEVIIDDFDIDRVIEFLQLMKKIGDRKHTYIITKI